MLEPLLIFLGFFAAGLWSAAPSVTFGDAGEFTACVATLGLPHAPGYPIYVLLAKALGTAFALGNWAYRTNIFSTLCGALALSIFSVATRRCGLSRPARLFAVLLLGLCALWRYESAVTEVFALHALFISSLILVVLSFAQTLCGDKPMAAAGLLFGLGASNHQTVILIFPAVAAQTWVAAVASATDGENAISYQRALQTLIRAAIVFGLFFILGLYAYLFLPLRAAHVPPLDWDQPTTWVRFWHMFLRKDYGSLSLTVNGPQNPTLQSWLLEIRRYLSVSVKFLGVPAAALAVLGAAAWPKLKLRANLAFPLLLFLIPGPLFLMMGNPPFNAEISSALERFYLASWLGVALLAGAGVEALATLLPKRGGQIAAWSLCLLPMWTGFNSLNFWNERQDFAAYDYGHAILHSLPESSSLFMDGGDDTFYSLAFLTLAHGLRPDVDLHDRGGLIFPNPYGPDFLALPKPMKEQRRIAVESALAGQGRLYYSTLNEHLLPGFILNPEGLLYYPSLSAGNPQLGSALWAVYPERWSLEQARAHYRDRALLAFYPSMRASGLCARGDFSSAVLNLKEAWLLAPDALWTGSQIVYQLGLIAYQAAQKSSWPLVREALELARAIHPDDVDVLCNLGVAYEHLGQSDAAQSVYLEAASTNPEWARAYYNLGELYWNMKRWNEAAAALDKAARMAHDSSWAALAAQAAFRASRPK